MNLIKKLFYPLQKYEYSVPMKKADFYHRLNETNLNAETHATYFTIRTKFPITKYRFYYTGRGDILSSSDKTDFQVIFDMSILTWIELAIFFFMMLVWTIRNITTSIANGKQITFDDFSFFIFFFLIYMTSNLIGQILVKNFNKFIKSLNGEIL